MKISPRTLLAAALLTALPMGGALACTISAWNGTGSATSSDAGGPTDGFARYSGVCALAVDSGKYVVDNSPSNEGVYRARFYVLTRAVASPVTVFKATATDNGGAAAATLSAEFNGSALSFTQNGNAVGSPITGLLADRWYSVEIFYKAGAAFEATVAGAGTDTPIGTVNVTTGIGSGTIGSAVLGVSSGTISGSTKFGFDAFESTRSEDTVIGRLCRGDATGDGALNIQDRIRLNNELNSFGANAAPGQPDCNENGTINTQDRICLNNRIANFDSCQ
ncbi:dockerin type I domain-containing protein [Xanthomonadaceae bacterium XH05]|nr:dockerin type I domain-containing protein [Xanthomonadaceae bacterium XH05]